MPGYKKLVCALFGDGKGANSTDKGVGGIAMFRFTASEIAAGIVTGFSLPFLADIIGIQSYEETAMTGDGLVSLSADGNSITATHTVSAASSAGSRTAVPDTDTNARDIAPNAPIVITLDSTPSAGSYCVGIEFRHA